MSRKLEYPRPDGQSVPGYLAEPAAGSQAPGVVVIQEWWGLNDQIRGVADRLADAGYRALVPDLYRGKATLEAKEAEHLMHGLDFGVAAGQDIRGAVQYLKASGSRKVAVTGFCMGGALTLLAAVNVPEADAAAVWYGYPPLEFVDASRIRIPLQGHWALHDAFFPIAGVDKLEVSLRAAGVQFEFHRYEARHAFANPEADQRHLETLAYSPENARLAWDRTLVFLNAQLA